MKEDIINFVDDFTVELNPKVQKKITDIHINKKNKIFVTYLPESDEKEILSAVEFVDAKGFTPIVHLPARTMRDIDHVENFLSQLIRLERFALYVSYHSVLQFANCCLQVFRFKALQPFAFQIIVWNIVV